MQEWLIKPLTVLKGVGPRSQKLLTALGLLTIQDLLFHLPLRYEDRTRLYPLNQLSVGQHVLIQGVIESAGIQPGKRRRLRCRLSDGRSFLDLCFFHFHPNQMRLLSQVGLRLQCFGEVRLGHQGLEMIHPHYQRVDEGTLELDQHLTPIYPTVAGLGQALIRKLVAEALANTKSGLLSEWLPEMFDPALGSMGLFQALTILHQPISVDGGLFEKARQRLAFEELLVYQLKLKISRQAVRRRQAPILDGPSDALIERFLDQLPFQLTAAQQRVWQQVETDLKVDRPMLRLLQGDVGSGKTLVALLAMLKAYAEGFQSVLMVPTEILADQHFRVCEKYLQPLGVRVIRLVGGLSAQMHRTALQAISAHEADVIVGTHAVFQQKVSYARLALVVVDEQHRFGVEQRLLLQEKGTETEGMPHQLIMTATPIPRTLAMTAYADLDHSIIDELPPGRLSVQTLLQSDQGKIELIARVQRYCESGHQVYWVCTLIEESEVFEAQAVEEAAQILRAHLSSSLHIALLHGRMSAADKQSVMLDFSAGNINVLVATTVIEVGVDVPNASLMVVENPERLGLAQLHQLRGRVGRGAVQSYCVLLYRQGLSIKARQRLQVMRAESDGFAIAEADLTLRGAGEILGKKQSGAMGFRVADLTRDYSLIEKAAALIDSLEKEVVEQLLHRWQNIYGEEWISA